MPLGPADSGFTLVSTVLTCFASLGCIVGGAVYLKLGMESQRGDLIVAFQSVVESWRGARARFEQLQVAATVSDEPVTLAPNHTMDAWHDAEGFVPDYQALVYRRRGLPDDRVLRAELSQMVSEAQRSPAEPRTATGGTASVSWSIGGSVVLSQAFPLLLAAERRTHGNLHNHCGQRIGVNVNGDCWVFSRLSRLCLQVAPASAGSSWQPAPKLSWLNASYGCDFASGEWAVAEYRPLSVENNREGWPRGAVRIDDLTLEVRSHQDPYFSGLELTRGTLNFGLSAEQEEVIGVVLLVIGMTLSLPLICALARSRAKNSWRRNAGRRYHSSGGIKRRHPDPETVGMRYATDMVDAHVDDARGLQRAIDRAAWNEEMERVPEQ